MKSVKVGHISVNDLDNLKSSTISSLFTLHVPLWKQASWYSNMSAVSYQQIELLSSSAAALIWSLPQWVMLFLTCTKRSDLNWLFIQRFPRPTQSLRLFLTFFVLLYIFCCWDHKSANTTLTRICFLQLVFNTFLFFWTAFIFFNLQSIIDDVQITFGTSL